MADNRNSDGDNSSKDPRKRTRKVRSRTMRRLRKLMLAGAASGAAIQADCDHSQVSADPAPPPLVCHENMTDGDYQEPGAFSADATWGFEWNTNTWFVEVSIHISYWRGDPLIFSGDPQIRDATMVDFSLTDRDLQFTCEPHDAVRFVQVSVPLDCNGYADFLNFDLDVSGERVPGQSVPMDGPFEYYPYY